MNILAPRSLSCLLPSAQGGTGSRKEKGLFYSASLGRWLGVRCLGRMRASTMIRLALLVSHLLHVGGFSLPCLSTWYFSCRHTFEDTLRSELYSSGAKEGATKLVAPGLLRVDRLPEDSLHGAWDLTYALQALPHARAAAGTESLFLKVEEGREFAGQGVVAARRARRGARGLARDRCEGRTKSQAASGVRVLRSSSVQEAAALEMAHPT